VLTDPRPTISAPAANVVNLKASNSELQPALYIHLPSLTTHPELLTGWLKLLLVSAAS